MTKHASHKQTVPPADARRVLMHAQGLLDDPDRAATPGSVREMIRQLGFVQLDTINVVERAHHLTLFSRMSGYEHEHLRTLHEDDRALFEHWTHDASILPIEYFAHWHYRRRKFVESPRVEKWLSRTIGQERERIIRQVTKRIEREGPLQSRDFEHEPGQTGTWWGWKPAKAALEYLWWRGDLSVIARRNFQKVYDLTERAYPDHHAIEPPDRETFIDFSCRESLHRLGIATPAEIAAFFNAITLAEAKRWCNEALARGDALEVEVAAVDGSPPRKACVVPDLDARVDRAHEAAESLDDRMRLLSPFDPVIRDRARCERLFGYHYRFEAFVPAAKRVYGYYVLPVLQGDRLIGRADVKHHRDRSDLEVIGVWWEDDVQPTKRMQAEFEQAVSDLALFVGAEHIVV